MPTLSAELVGDSAKHCAQFVGLSILRSGAAAFCRYTCEDKGSCRPQRCLHWGLRLEEATQCLQRSTAKPKKSPFRPSALAMPPLELPACGEVPSNVHSSCRARLYVEPVDESHQWSVESACMQARSQTGGIVSLPEPHSSSKKVQGKREDDTKLRATPRGRGLTLAVIFKDGLPGAERGAERKKEEEESSPSFPYASSRRCTRGNSSSSVPSPNQSRTKTSEAAGWGGSEWAGHRSKAKHN